MISEAIGRMPVGRASTAAAAPARARPEPALGGFARLAANACGAHCASIAIEGQPDVWSSSTAVLPDGAVPARDAFAGYTSRAFGVFEVPDIAADDRFAQSGTAIDGQVVRSYAGCALRNAAGEVLGTLGIYQTTSRFLSQGQRTTLALIAEQAVAAIEMQSRLIELSLLSAETSPAAARRPSGAAASALLESAPVAIYHTDAAGNMPYSNAEYRRIFGLAADYTADAWAQSLHPDDRARMELAWADFCREPSPRRFAYRTLTGAGTVRHFSEHVVAADGMHGWVGTITDITDLKAMDEELERVHKQLVSASRRAGMAEVATNVLHNVGNTLNSINISASLVIGRLKQSKSPGVSRLAALLQEQGAGVGEFIAHDERGKHIPKYLTSLGEQLSSDRRMALEELASLRDNLEHIKETIAMQQSYARLGGVTETIAVAELVEDSLRLNAGEFVRHGVSLEREFDDVPPITVDKHKVLQILVNLVRNAKYACDDSGRSDKLITLKIEPATAAAVRICVIDNGVGIPAPIMSRLFTHGFTTRTNGHGFGLHSGALAAAELGGSLRVVSDGPGCGATFILELPASPPPQAARA